MVIAGLALLFVGGILVWQALGRGPRRRRAFRQIQRWLAQGNWPQALQQLQLFSGQKKLSSSWQQRLGQAAGECHRAAAQAALLEKKFELALEHSLQAGKFLGQQEFQARDLVRQGMLSEVRRLFASSRGAETASIHALNARIFSLPDPCPEASFWEAMCFLREGQGDRALASFQKARGRANGENGINSVLQKTSAWEPGRANGENGINSVLQKTSAWEPARASLYIDPPLYLGALLLAQGRAKEALRYLSEANRINSGNCPFVTWQLGAAILQAGGDVLIGVRTLQRALGPRGFLQWAQAPQRAWQEGLPQNRSFVRKLAGEHAFVCPLWGNDLQIILRHGNIALGQGLYRLGQFQEAAETFNKLLQEGAPSVPVLRGLGLALARLGQYDQAFKHLRIAQEMEDPKDRLTAGYLALCGAKGTPTRPEDKVKNVTWAIRLVSRFTAPGDVEWAELINSIFAEARRISLPLDKDEQIYLCEHLASVQAADQLAAEAFLHLERSYAEAVHPEYAWLFCRAAQAHGVAGEHCLALFARTFAEPDRARDFFSQKSWDFTGVELAYLERAASLEPGAFPASLGADYPPRGEKLLLDRSRQQEQDQQPDAALASAEALFQLAPRSIPAHDRLAYLHYRRGNRDQALTFLQAWQDLKPDDPWPLVRQAVIFQERNDPDQCLEKITLALNRSRDRFRAEVAFLGARLFLKEVVQAPAEGEGENRPDPNRIQKARQAARDLLEECLKQDPQHLQALWILAALKAGSADVPGLARQAAGMDQAGVADPRFHFLAGVCQLAAGNYRGVLEACRRCAEREKNNLEQKSPTASSALNLVVESAYLAGAASWLHQDTQAAKETLRVPAEDLGSPSRAHAQALLGKIFFANQEYAEAIRCWRSLDPKKRLAWKFSDTLAGAVFLTALEAFQGGKFAEAAEKIREAGRLGLRDRRLGMLLTLALVKAGQTLLYHE